MRYITDSGELQKVEHYMHLASRVARFSKCRKSQRGVVIVLDDKIIGLGYNKPMLEELCCLRDAIKDNGRVELCTAIHAEQFAIINALSQGCALPRSRMYHIKLKNNEMTTSGKPSCTLCSRLIRFSGVSEVVLWHEEGYAVYGAEEFNRLSFEYFMKK